MSYSPLIERLVNSLCHLPSVGPKSAQRIAFNLLDKQRDNGLELADALQQALTQVTHCEFCRNFTESSVCHICRDEGRDTRTICVVENPADLIAIEQTATYKGYYFVLMGHLSPIDGIGPQELQLDRLQQRLQDNPDMQELILATGTTPEGEATAYYIAEMAQQYNLSVSRLAYGIPLGGELEYIDNTTLQHAFSSRQGFT